MSDGAQTESLPIPHFPLPCLSPPDRHDNFERVAIGKRDVLELAARHDFAVALQRYTLAPQFQFFDEPGNVQGSCERPRSAVDRKCNHFKKVRSSVSIPC